MRLELLFKEETQQYHVNERSCQVSGEGK